MLVRYSDADVECASLAAWPISGVGRSGWLPPLAAACLRGRLSEGDPAGGDDSTGLTLEDACPLSNAAAAGPGGSTPLYY